MLMLLAMLWQIAALISLVVVFVGNGPWLFNRELYGVEVINRAPKAVDCPAIGEITITGAAVAMTVPIRAPHKPSPMPSPLQTSSFAGLNAASAQ